MATQIEYHTEKELDTAIAKLLRDDPYGASLAKSIKIVGCFVQRVGKDDEMVPGKGDPVKLKKVPPEMQVLMSSEASFVLVVDYHFWQTAPEEQKRGYLGLAISRIMVEKTDNGLKVRTRKFDVQTNIAVIKKYGLFTENLSLMGEAVSSLTKAQLEMTQATLDRLKPKPLAPEKDGEAERKKSPAAAQEKAAAPPAEESEERILPPRRVPPDPEPEPEPEPQD